MVTRTLHKIWQLARAVAKENDRVGRFAYLAANRLQDSTTRPLVSIIVEPHEASVFSRRCLESVWHQNYRHFECLIMRQPSSAAGRARDFWRHDQRFRDCESGPWSAVLREVRGEYLIDLGRGMVLPQDTVWFLVRALGRDASGGLAGAYIDASLENGGQPREMMSFFDWRGAARMPPTAPLLKTRILRRLGASADESPNDPALWLRLLRHGYRLVPVPQPHPGAAIEAAPLGDPEIARLDASVERDLASGEITAGTPFLFREPLSSYEHRMARARTRLQNAVAALLGDDLEAFTRELDAVAAESWHLCAREMGMPAVVDACFRQATPARERGRQTGKSERDRVLSQIYTRARAQNQAGATDVLFLPHSDYHAREMAAAVPHLRALGLRSRFLNRTDGHRGDGIEPTLRALGAETVDFRDFDDCCLWQHTPALVLVMNDWGATVRAQVLRAQQLGIPTCGLVEGAQDYEDRIYAQLGSELRRHPYQTVDYPLLIGEFDRRFISNPRAAVVGSPRLEALLGEPVAFPDEPLVVINCNFTYGVFTHVRRLWLRQVIAACRRLGVAYAISQHPADSGDLTGLGVSSEPLYELLRRGSVLVSRFSGALLEAMALGKPVIYHNPHGERAATFAEPLGAYPITTGLSGLTRELAVSLERSWPRREQTNGFFQLHVSIDPKMPAAERIAGRVAEIVDR